MKLGSVARRVRQYLPEGARLSGAEWQRRHRVITRVLLLHVPTLSVVGLVTGFGLWHSVLEVIPIVACWFFARRPHGSRSSRVAWAAAGLVSCSAVLIHLTEGVIESHFHFFVVIGLVSLYYDWLPFLVAIAFTAIHHGVLGTIQPERVYSHGAGEARPWVWAGVHAGFVLAASAANVLSWRLNEEDHRQAEEAIARLSRDNELILRSAGEGIFGLDRDGRVTFVNPAACELLRLDANDLVGQDMHVLVHHSRADGQPLLLQDSPICAVLGDGERRRVVDEVFWRSNGTSFPVEYTATAIEGLGGAVGAVVTFRDVTDRKDPVTGLDGRAWFLNHTRAALREVPKSDLAVLFVDVDRFKLINDTMGHPTGDEVLVGVARRLQAAIRPSDVIARFGGDEFIVLCRDVHQESDVEAIAGRLLEAFDAPFQIGTEQLYVSISVGVAIGGHANQDAEILVRDADTAMYRAKRRGGRCHQVFDHSMRAEVVERLWLEGALRHALDRGEFRLVYQPLIRIDTGQICGAEALLRWDHPGRQVIGPDAFVPLAEETGLIVPIGAWVLEEACAQAVRWQSDPDAPMSVSMSVNVSAVQLADPQFVAIVAETLARTGLRPELLCLEVTETAVMHDAEKAAAVLRELKVLGVRLAIDDFGTGYSSLAYLRQLPVDTLKIDRAFVSGLDGGTEDSAIVAAAIKLAHALQLGVVAEGVETVSQLAHLQALDCEAAQGYYFSAPVTPVVLAGLAVRTARTSPGGDGASRSATPARMRSYPF